MKVESDRGFTAGAVKRVSFSSATAPAVACLSEDEIANKSIF